MYTAYVDGLPLYDPANGFVLEAPELDLELNKTGSFSFTIYPTHPYFSALKRLASVVEVYDRQQLVFKGRIINDEETFYGARSIECEGELAYLLDTHIRPYTHQGTLPELFEKFVNEHNERVPEEKQFKVGEITVTDPNDYVNYSDSTYLTTWDSINEKLIKTHGGYLFARHESDGVYLDYVDDFTLLSRQSVEFGKNLLDLTRSNKGEEIATAVIPLGAKNEETEQRLTVAEVNGGSDVIIDEEAVAQWGYVETTVEYDNVTVPANLLRKGKEYLATVAAIQNEIEISAVDLAALDADIGSFHLGTYVKVTSEHHDIDANFLVKKIGIDLSDPSGNTLTLGSTYQSFTEQQYDTKKNYESTKNNLGQTIANVANVQIESVAGSMISQTAEQIYQDVSESYYLKDEAQTLIQQISTQFEQTNDEFTFTFNEFKQEIEAAIAGQDGKFTDITKYIRFVDGNIVLGVEGNPLTLKIRHDRISFLEGNLEVAYFSNQQLHVTNANVISNMQMGNFMWYPRSNGNLTLRYTGGGA